MIAVSRGARGPYQASPRWSAVTTVTADREAEDARGTFGERIAALRPEVVIDLICFTAASARQLVEALAWLVGNGQADIGGQPFPVRSRPVNQSRLMAH